MYHSKRIHPDANVFLGDSLTEWFDLEKYFPGKNVVNRGISGDTSLGVLYRYEEILKAGPARLFILIGINDIFEGVRGETLISNIQSMLETLASECPATKIYLQSILPVNETSLIAEENINTIIYSLNRRLKKLCQDGGPIWIDLHSHFLNSTGEMDPVYTHDGVHLSREGYRLWASLISDIL